MSTTHTPAASIAELLKRRNTPRQIIYVRWSYLKELFAIRFAQICGFLWRFSLGRWIFIKAKPGSSLTEAMTMRFIATHTSIPVPRVLLHFQWGITGFIVMNRVRGIVLQDVWESYSMETKKAIIEQLAGFVAQLRSLRSPFGMAVCSVLGGCVGDYRLNYEPSGPFRDEAHMNLQLRYLAALEDCAEDVKSAHSRSHPIVFTHGDLAPRNIMVEGGTITSILDWESAGWFPAHWEYCKARFASFGPLEHSWDPWITKCIPPFETESAVTMRLLKERWIPRAKA